MKSQRRKISDWDGWWRGRIASLRADYDPLITPLEGLKVTQFAPRYWRSGFRRVLIAGNGVTIVPWALAHCGFEVVALDISAVATEFASNYVPNDREFHYFFQLNEDASVGDHRDAYFRPGGSMRFVCGDFMDPACEPGPFDLILCWRATQHLESAELLQALLCMHRRLSSIGSWHITVQNDGSQWTEIANALSSLGYVVHPRSWPPEGRCVLGGVASG